MDRFKYILNLVTVALLMVTVAVNRDGRIGGHTVEDLVYGKPEQQSVQAVTTLDNGGELINTKAIVKDIVGFGGETPLNIIVVDGVVTSVELGENSETPQYIDLLKSKGLFEQWNGLTLTEASAKKVDVVSGATLSSVAIIETFKQSAAQIAKVELASSSVSLFTAKNSVALLVILFGVVLTFLPSKKRWMRTLLLALNVGVLGFWCGSFLSLSMFTSWGANGVNFAVATIPVLLLLVAIILPLFGKKGSYCAYHCPLGSAQELMGGVVAKKVKLSSGLLNILSKIRGVILSLLLFFMWCGIGFSLMDYELFSAFMIESASWVILSMGAVFMLLSIIIPRPYCRFICPTGALLNFITKK